MLIFTFVNIYSTPLTLSMCLTRDFNDLVDEQKTKMGNLTNSELMMLSNASKRYKSDVTFPIMTVLSLLSLKEEACMYSPNVTFSPLKTDWFNLNVAERNIKLHRFCSFF